MTLLIKIPVRQEIEKYRSNSCFWMSKKKQTSKNSLSTYGDTFARRDLKTNRFFKKCKGSLPKVKKIPISKLSDTSAIPRSRTVPEEKHPKPAEKSAGETFRTKF